MTEATNTIKAMHHVAISTADLEKLIDFYVNDIGFEVLWRNQWSPGNDKFDRVIGLRDSAARSAMLRFGEMCIELFEFSQPTPMGKAQDYPACDHGITHFAFIVDDIHAEYERLSSKGVRFHSVPQETAGSWSVYLRDPDGNIFEFIEFAADHDETAVPAA